MRDLGKAGEEFFSGWCAISGMVANKAVSDKNGWDLLVEIDPGHNTLDPLSLHEGIVETKVQIKATDGSSKSVQVELSNLKKMSTTPLPTFYVLVEFNNTDAPTAAYLYHVDKVLIEKVLKRIAVLTSTNKKVKLNERSMTLKFSESILPFTATRLREMMISIIGRSSLSYIEEKSKNLKTVGFEQGAHKLDFSIKGDAQLERLIDMSLGAKGSIDINNVHGSSLRFGIPTDLPQFNSDTAVLEMTNVIPHSSGSLKFKDSTSGRSLVFSADLYLGMLNSWIPDDLKKVRVESKLFEIQLIGLGKTLKFTAHFDFIKDFDITEGLQLFKLLDMFVNPNGVLITLSFPEVTTTISLHQAKGFSDCSHVIEAMEQVLKIKKHFDFYDPVSMSLSELEKLQPKLAELSVLIDGAIIEISVSLSVDVRLEVGTEVDCLYVAAIHLGPCIFAELLLINGKISQHESERHAISIKKVKSLYRTTIKSISIEKATLKEELKSVSEAYESKCTSIDLVPCFFTDFLDAES